MSRPNKHKLHNSWEVVVAKTLDQVEEIRPIWQEIQNRQPEPTPNADIDRYLSILQARRGEVQPWVMVLTHKDVIVSMLIGRIEMHQLHCRIGYKVIYKPSLRCLTIVYGGILGEQNEIVCTKMIAELELILQSGKVDMLYFSHLKTDSLVFQIAKKRPNVFCRDHVTVVCPHWQTPLPDSADKFYHNTLSRNDRHNLRRYTKKLEKDSSEQVKMICYHDVSELDHFVNAASQISSLTYQQALNVGFSNNHLIRSLLIQSAKARWLRAYVLYAGTEPVAFEAGSVYGKTYFAEYRGFDPKCKPCSPGTVLLLRVLEDLSGDPAVDAYDYGYGDALYKKRYGRKSWPEASVYVFAPRFYPIFVNLTQCLVRATYTLFNFLATKMGILEWSKRSWRTLLQQKSSKNSN